MYNIDLLFFLASYFPCIHYSALVRESHYYERGLSSFTNAQLRIQLFHQHHCYAISLDCHYSSLHFNRFQKKDGLVPALPAINRVFIEATWMCFAKEKKDSQTRNVNKKTVKGAFLFFSPFYLRPIAHSLAFHFRWVFYISLFWNSGHVTIYD